MSPFDATEPHAPFDAWFAEACAAELDVPDAIQLATTSHGAPSLRTVLLKQWGAQGWFVYTNYGSQKAREMDENPIVAGLLHWKALQRQVRVVARAERATAEVSDAYFASRDRGSQLGAWASRQSEALEARGALERRLAEVEARFEGQPVPRPDFWGGYRLVLSSVEFWQGRADRLHDRVLFARAGEDWERTLLYP
jgi:pyridoxamine 5'-phosphate oxidase